ncbi:DUF3757 domain-containing protein [Pseudomonas sp. FSL R10-1350]|uniref:DUF3757 domain-containing protein n=1 Tax=Pseudomonas TaxID=286 RepID=UPI00069E068A|nr:MULTISPECIES: DUF3757 domain-containing protein [Pseudomonas]MQU62263.1 DUF3757 domain-containing protein [Pseudomonas sp. FSL R10-1350]
MTKSLTKMSAGIITMMALMGNAYAATTACPAVSDIRQTADGNGFSYTAAAPNGQQWVGGNPMADESDLKNVTFKMASIRTNASKTFVACDYEGKKDEAVRMSLTTKPAAKPVGTAWKGNECKENNQELCTFE